MFYAISECQPYHGHLRKQIGIKPVHSPDQPQKTSAEATMAPITHIVIFQYKIDTTVEQKQDISKAFLALRDTCLSPVHANFTSPGKPYIQSIIAGSNNSAEEVAQGYEVSLSLDQDYLSSLNISPIACLYCYLRLFPA